MNMPTTRPGLRFRPLVWALLLGCILTYPFSPAVSRPPGDKRDYILVINTYAESTPWSRGIIADITAHVEQIENLELYTEHMTLLLVDSPEDIRTFEANLLREYGKKPPQALVLIGTPAALLRNFINSIWQDIPTIVCAEQDFIGPDKYYLKRQPIPASEQVPLRALADQDNLTLLYSPAYLDQSIDLMKRILPGMDRLVFIDDARYVNRQTEHDLAELLGSKYPGMKYTVYSADKIGIDQLLDSLSTVDVKQHRRALLLVALPEEHVRAQRNHDQPVQDHRQFVRTVVLAASDRTQEQRHDRGLRIRRERIFRPADRHHRCSAGGQAAARHSLLHPGRCTTRLQLPGTAPAQHLPERLPDEYPVFRQTVLVHGAV